ncbi:MAG: DUF2062 domain-containing protein [Candidatus Deferrimicrobiaceae bacterium]
MIGWGKIWGKLHEAVAADSDERSLAAGFAVGVFFSFSPLVTLHMVLALLVAVVLRVNKMTTMVGVWVNNPYTMPFVFYGCFRLGEWILGMDIPPPSFETYTLKAVLKAAVPYAAPLFLGTTIVGLAAAVLAYVVVYRIAVRIKSARREGMR